MTPETTSLSGHQIAVVINGAPLDISPDLTVDDWLKEAGRDPRTVAIEINGCILPRDRYSETALVDGDRLEVVQFVQGG